MKVKYVGESFGVDGLTDGCIYECVAIEGKFLRVIDDSGEDYLYSASSPCAMDEPDKCGVWVVVEDTSNNKLEKFISKLRETA